MNFVQRMAESAITFVFRGIQLWSNAPSLRPLFVISTENTSELPVVIINLEVAEHVGGQVVRKPCRIGLDPYKRRVVREHTTPWLLGDAPYTPGDAQAKSRYVPLGLLTSPIAVPLILSMRKHFRQRESWLKMSRHGAELMVNLGNQLDEDILQLLVDALRADWELQTRRTRELSFEEAQRFLSECRMVVCRATDCLHTPMLKDLARASETISIFHWFHPEHGHIGQCYVTLRAGPLFRVYNTDFSERLGELKGYDVFDLFNCYTVKRDDTKAAEAHAPPPAA